MVAFDLKSLGLVAVIHRRLALSGDFAVGEELDFRGGMNSTGY